ncbi:MAG: hypothetical protein HOE01_01275 [Thaumarchaeota archaeon]|jgi:hypothetical protein|nr:hypothetical protein [Nitrososphaerota archaeon]
MQFSKVSWIVLFFSITISSISLISVIFPALIAETVSNNGLEELGISQHEENPFQTGPLAILLIFTNIIIFGTYFLRNRFPNKIFKSFKKGIRFNPSTKVTTISIIIILSAYIILTIPELEKSEEFKDIIGIEKRLNESIRDDRFTFEDAISGNQNYSLAEPHVKYSILLISEKVFGDFRIIAFFASVSLLLLTYLITNAITNNRFAGLVALLLVVQSNLFLSFDTSAVYSNFWILFYLLSLYLLVKVWFATPILFGISIFCKMLTAIFTPMSIFFILNSEISNSQKIIISSIIVILLIVGGIIFLGTQESDKLTSFEIDRFWESFASFAFQMRLDIITVLFLLPLIFGLFLSSKKFKHANSISILISGVLLSGPILAGITDQTNQPYRLIPIIVFFAIGVGMLFPKIK